LKRVDSLAEDDRARATAICGAQGWSAQLTAWLTAYDAYGARRGNPKRLKKATILPSVETDLYGLYDAPEGKLISDAIREISTGSCPMCGSANTGTVDHFLPRRDYPEFSIFTPNLVPACPACNMFTKRLRFQGPLPHEHLLHPHYDRLLDHPIWLVTFHGNTNAVTFKAVPVARLAAGTASRVQFHLDTVLGREFRKTMRALWRNHLSARLRGGRKEPEQLDRGVLPGGPRKSDDCGAPPQARWGGPARRHH
jgi:hypothetical protein